MTQTHTPGPWRHYRRNPYEYAIHGSVGTIYEHDIARVRFGLEARTSAKQAQSAEANAAYIVRACNAHEELVKALHLAVPELIAYYGKHHFVVAACRQALDLAHGTE